MDNKDLGILAMAIRGAARYIQDNAHPDSEVYEFVRPLHNLSDAVFDAGEAVSRRKYGLPWPPIGFDQAVAKKTIPASGASARQSFKP